MKSKDLIVGQRYAVMRNGKREYIGRFVRIDTAGFSVIDRGDGIQDNIYTERLRKLKPKKKLGSVVLSCTRILNKESTLSNRMFFEVNPNESISTGIYNITIREIP